MAKKKALTTEQIQAAIHGYVSDAVTYMESELSPNRATATKYYMGEPFGNEETGRSQFVMTVVRDTVLAMLNPLLRILAPMSGYVIEYQARPKNAEDIQRAVDLAQQATDYVNGIVLDADNDFFSALYACVKDALVRKIGWLKWWWEDASTYKSYTANDLDVLQYEQLANDPDVEDLKYTVSTNETGIPRYNVEYTHWRREGYARISCGPPEELLICRDARSRDDALFMAHRTDKSDAELLEMGVSQSDIDEWGGPSSELRQSVEETARRGGISNVQKAATPGEQGNLWIEAWPIIDGQLYKVLCLGPDCHIIGEPEPLDERPIALFCPDPEPHVVVGQCPADRVMDLQLMTSSVVRAYADGTADAIFPTTYYMEGVVDLQAMQSTAIGRQVAVRDGLQPAQAILEQRHEFDGAAAMQLLNYLDGVLQKRIGPLPTTLDPDALQSTPEVGVKATVQASAEQIELIARVLAQTGMKQLGKGLLKLLVEHQPRARIVRLRNQFVAVDPKAWDADMDVSVHVAVGTTEKLGVLAATAQDQKEILGALGPANPLVGLGQYRHTRATMLELQGIKDTSKFYNALPIEWMPPQQPQAPDPNLLLAQAEMQKAQTGLAKAQSEFEVEKVKAAQQMADLQAQLQSKAADLILKREEIHLVDERERDKAEADIAVKMAEINAKYGTQLRVHDGEAQLEREKMATDVHVASLQPAPSNGNGEKPDAEKPKPQPKKKGPKITKVTHDAQGRVSELRTEESE